MRRQRRCTKEREGERCREVGGATLRLNSDNKRHEGLGEGGIGGNG